MASVRLENVYKKYDNKNIAVNDVSINIQDKEFIVLVGPSGCGKSTTLRMVAGLEEISEGNIFIDEKLVNDVAPKDRDIAMVFQNYALYPHMSVYENLAFGLKIRKHDKADIDTRVRNAALILGIADYLERKPKALSGGQRQRVALGRAIVRNPKVFLFDEPLSNLDANLRVQMRTEISRLHKQLQTTMIYVTHDQIEAMSLGDRIVVMKGGLVQQVDSPLNIYHKPANKFVAGFIGSPTMNFIDGTITNTTGLTFKDTAGSLSLPLSIQDKTKVNAFINKEVSLGIRPESIYAKAQNETSQSLNVQLDVTEPVGNEIFLYFKIGKSPEQFVSRIPSDIHPTAGKEFQLFFDTSKLHFFDKTTGESLL
ncbi:MAG: sn-glycerol-3-phosphate ABC transporter ATP-binding protein UgpC [Ignavibacteriales bacterium]|nr:sn-glycerol-3-phosphate ABC transporter ATP-binding protein UgpC [Ignavibacteriales bacterium]